MLFSFVLVPIEKQFRKIQSIQNSRRMYYLQPIGNQEIRKFLPKKYIDFVIGFRGTNHNSFEFGHQCTICFEAMTTTGKKLWTLPCHHTFHHECIGQWVQNCTQQHRTPTCALCRTEFSPPDIQIFYHTSSELVHTKLYNFAENTVTINGRIYDIHEETQEEKVEAIQRILDHILKQVRQQDSAILETIMTYLDDNGIDSSEFQEKIVRFNSTSSCCMS
jgi:hypothetical protein|tara:strand:- start:104 stop:760 length:657 start_codon:yes stop_codon:yes gene_type:complete